MSQAPSQDMINAMRVAEWKAEAALTGQTFAQVACAAMKGGVVVRKAGLTAHEGWTHGIDADIRGLLIAAKTDRPTDKAERVRWDQLTEREKLDVGVLVRRMAAQFPSVAQGLR